MGRVGLVSKLVFNALRYRWLKLTGQPGRLEAISLEVTHRCFCRCRMCNIWQIPKELPDLPLSTWTELLSSPGLQGLREIDITGGEPFLRDDLGELISWICQAKAERFPHLRTLAVTTNGVLTQRVVEQTTRLIGSLQQQGIDLVLACGMDGVGPVHDRIRGLPGAWEKLSRTLEGLLQLRKEHPNLILGIKTTIIPDNIAELDKITTFAQEHGLFTIISPRIITANRFGNRELEESLNFSKTDIDALKEFFAKPEVGWGGHGETLVNYFVSKRVQKPCSAGFNTVFVRHNGELFPCPVISNPLGNIRNELLTELLSSPQAAAFRRKVGHFSECRSCTEPGLERLAWLYEGGGCLQRMLRSGQQNVYAMLGQMGLDKYL